MDHSVQQTPERLACDAPTGGPSLSAPWIVTGALVTPAP